ncbi:hypothetical protein WN51_10289 [Melipona quadrifasciata]|uniref:Uncharacterized protein n=1 Tax=Melipona quadrifasciata TaxID=166423 RepID=A0A0M9A732_9HYME|nr:hypothetical protein WN51_10289 [Melipona quadrifasciata]
MARRDLSLRGAETTVSRLPSAAKQDKTFIRGTCTKISKVYHIRYTKQSPPPGFSSFNYTFKRHACPQIE